MKAEVCDGGGHSPHGGEGAPKGTTLSGLFPPARLTSCLLLSPNNVVVWPHQGLNLLLSSELADSDTHSQVDRCHSLLHPCSVSLLISLQIHCLGDAFPDSPFPHINSGYRLLWLCSCWCAFNVGDWAPQWILSKSDWMSTSGLNNLIFFTWKLKLDWYGVDI